MRSTHSRLRICLLANPPDRGFPPNAAALSPPESSSLELFLCLHILSLNCEEAGAQPALPGAASRILCPAPSATPTFCQVTITDQLHPLPSSPTTSGKLPNPCEPQPPRLQGGEGKERP